MKGRTIFKRLERGKVCYAVCMSNNYLRETKAELKHNENADVKSREYFLITMKSKQKLLKNLNFKENESNRFIVERNLSLEEANQFKETSNEFVLVKTNKYGKIYELPTDSFKAKYNSKVVS